MNISVKVFPNRKGFVTVRLQPEVSVTQLRRGLHIL
jgi:hypothetical protein